MSIREVTQTMLKMVNAISKDLLEEMTAKKAISCRGCEIDHPSQTKHSCVMETFSEYVEENFHLHFGDLKWSKYTQMIEENVAHLVKRDISNKLGEFVS